MSAPSLVEALASRVSEALADERIARHAVGDSDLSIPQEWDLARSAATAECARLSAARRSEGGSALNHWIKIDVRRENGKTPALGARVERLCLLRAL